MLHLCTVKQLIFKILKSFIEIILKIYSNLVFYMKICQQEQLSKVELISQNQHIYFFLNNSGMT